jgi:hypothetical protein
LSLGKFSGNLGKYCAHLVDFSPFGIFGARKIWQPWCQLGVDTDSKTVTVLRPKVQSIWQGAVARSEFLKPAKAGLVF